MIFKGRVKITMDANCGWSDDETINYEVDCDDQSGIKDAIKKKYEYLAGNYHYQTGCEYDCTTGITIHL